MSETNRSSVRAIARVVIVGAFALAAPHAAAAQTATYDVRWQPWLGCWQAADSVAAVQVLCVVPAGIAGVTMISLVNGKEVTREIVDAAGSQRLISRQGCEGSESARWSSDARRVYVRSEMTCTGGLKRTSRGILAISPQGEWLGIESVRSGEGGEVRITRYRDAGLRTDLPAEITTALAGQQNALGTARIAAGASIGSAAVVEASREVDAAGLQAFLIERGQPFNVDASLVASLADAGVPPAATDALIALSYPARFVVDRATGVPEQRASTGAPGRSSGWLGGGLLPSYYGRSSCASMFATYGSPWFGSSLGSYDNMYSYSPYGYGFGSTCSPYALGRYGFYGSGSYRYGSRTPYVIARSGPSGPSGQAVNGAGYRRRGTSAGATPRTAAPRGGSLNAGGSVRGSRGSSAARGGSASSGRTARRRP